MHCLRIPTAEVFLLDASDVLCPVSPEVS